MIRCVGVDQVGDQGAQGVVVAELDFVGDDGVVLVDDRHNAQFEQGDGGRAGVEVALRSARSAWVSRIWAVCRPLRAKTLS